MFKDLINMKEERSFPTLTVSLPKETWNKIHWVVRNDPLFEAPEDLIVHAVTDLLESYKRR